MSKKFYLIEATFGEDTRIANSFERFEELLEQHCRVFFETWTNGSVPSIQVKETKQLPYDAHEAPSPAFTLK